MIQFIFVTILLQ